MLAFVLAHLGAVSLAGLGTTAVAAIALEIFVPGSIPLIRTAISTLLRGLQWLIGTTTGRVILFGLACVAAGWGARAFVDHSADLRRALAAQQQATAAAQAQAAAEHEQAVATNALNDAASRRAEAAEAQSEDLQEQVTDYASQLAAAAKAAPAKRCSRALTAADVAALARIGAPRGRR